MMTLRPGELILTDGVVDWRAGDRIVCEIEGIGALENWIVAAGQEEARARFRPERYSAGDIASSIGSDHSS